MSFSAIIYQEMDYGIFYWFLNSKRKRLNRKVETKYKKYNKKLDEIMLKIKKHPNFSHGDKPILSFFQAKDIGKLRPHWYSKIELGFECEDRDVLAYEFVFIFKDVNNKKCMYKVEGTANGFFDQILHQIKEMDRMSKHGNLV